MLFRISVRCRYDRRRQDLVDVVAGQDEYIFRIIGLQEVDVLVDGEFILEKKDITLQFRGSSNQRIVTRDQFMI